MFARPDDPDPVYTELVELDLATVEPSWPGPRVRRTGWRSATPRRRSTAPWRPHQGGTTTACAALGHRARTRPLSDGHVVIAAITSCTNTSNPQVMLGAGLLAKKARGARARAPSPGSRHPSLRGRGWSWTTRARRAARAARRSSGSTSSASAARRASATRAHCCPECPRRCSEGDLSVAAVLSGNRNFEGRIHPDVRLNYLASPPLVVAYALAGTMDVDLDQRAARHRRRGAARLPARPLADRRGGGGGRAQRRHVGHVP